MHLLPGFGFAVFCGDERADVFRGSTSCLREATGMAFFDFTLKQGNLSSGNTYGLCSISLWTGLSKLQSILEPSFGCFKICKFLIRQIRSLRFAGL